jgi:hypothetical protein
MPTDKENQSESSKREPLYPPLFLLWFAVGIVGISVGLVLALASGLCPHEELLMYLLCFAILAGPVLGVIAGVGPGVLTYLLLARSVSKRTAIGWSIVSAAFTSTVIGFLVVMIPCVIS